MEQINPDVLISEDDISLRINALAKAINEDFSGEELVVICVLKGAFMFCSDLIKKIELPVRLEFIQLSSYGDGMTSTGNVKIEMDVSTTLKDKNVLIVEDIVDTGLTITTLLKMLEIRDPKQVKLASLLFKPSRNKHKVPIDYLGFEIEDKFVIGYGLDYAGRYRELPYIGVLNAGN
ncbi:MAG: hypoxanthine phosphoribosyltransferase [Bacteriovoracaceae bacterium]|jgi:hypoxanthine phosphoribosyltransferase|nr:hypoxanthine phosphoribosyltransferase [Halobacteriovoraceae bacterium]MDP7321635.1 hypoxanthine phosphoribosyltransferase [Bacteriovoracaceae bacterium]|tara:strand:- start:184 stop:714 length:531 start_codon:yes stop_codon:yes gene_type:complete